MTARTTVLPSGPWDGPRVSGGLRVFMIGAGLIAPAVFLIVSMARASVLTIDDAYISFRYARNLVRGLGLVYNPGERIEGYTDFLWTLIIAGGLKLGALPEITAKVVGGASALGTLAIAWRLSAAMQPVRLLPPLAPWLLATSANFAGYAVAGLETIFFVFLIVLATWRLEEELERPRAFPWSGVAYALAGLTRPEAPLFLSIAMLVLGRRVVRRQNLLRGLIFVSIVGAHLVWRHHYYGAWLPNTFHAKTGNPSAQVASGIAYLGRYLGDVSVVMGLALVGVAVLVTMGSPIGIISAVTAAGIVGYVVLVGGDWMPLWRFMTPFEPFACLLSDVGFRAAVDRNRKWGLADPSTTDRAVVWTLLGIFAVTGLVQRAFAFPRQLASLAVEQRGWDRSARPIARWLVDHGRPGLIGVGDIGYIGWATDYPLLDILGLVDPVIARLPGGYGAKQGPAYLDYFFARSPDYFILISDNGDCQHPFHASIGAIYEDPARRFKDGYRVLHRVDVTGGYGWCIFGRVASAGSSGR